jgi:predicted MPP superfamily phosphohydrolase
MKPILHVADLHARAHWLKWLVSESCSANWSAVVIAGDLLDMFAPPSQMRAQIARVCASLLEIPRDIPLLICTGNHDHVFGKSGSSALWLRSFARQRPKTYIDGRIAILGGISFEIVGWNQAPQTAADFYVVHNPPEGAKTAISDGRDWGDFLLSEHLEVHEGIALSGHIHSPASWFDLKPGRRSLNPSVGDLSQAKSDAPAFISIDIARRLATRAGEAVRI